jgi:hypothetical protein
MKERVLSLFAFLIEVKRISNCAIAIQYNGFQLNEVQLKAVKPFAQSRENKKAMTNS